MASTNYVSRKDGETIDPATADLQREVRELLEHIKTSNAELDLLAGPDVAIVNATSTTLHDLGVEIEPNIRRIILIPHATAIFWADGTATTGSTDMLTTQIELNVSFDTISTREFIVASGTINLYVIQEG